MIYMGPSFDIGVIIYIYVFLFFLEERCVLAPCNRVCWLEY